jgi:hypothetical protein
MLILRLLHTTYSLFTYHTTGSEPIAVFLNLFLYEEPFGPFTNVAEPLKPAVLKLGVATLLRVARYFFRVAKISQDLS